MTHIFPGIKFVKKFLNFFCIKFSDNRNMHINKPADIGIFILRTTVSIFMLSHGIPKLGMLLSGNSQNFLNPIGIGSTTSLLLCVIAEVLCPVLIIFGAFTKAASAVLCLNMAAALIYLCESGAKFGGGIELAALYLVIFAALTLTGGGAYSLDGRKFGRN